MGACISKTKASAAAAKTAKKNAKAGEDAAPKNVSQEVPQESKATAEVADTTTSKSAVDPVKDAEKAVEEVTDRALEKDAGKVEEEVVEQEEVAEETVEDDAAVKAEEADIVDKEAAFADAENDDDVTPVVADADKSATRALDISAIMGNVDAEATTEKTDEPIVENKEAAEAAEAAAKADAAAAADAEAASAELEALMVGTLTAVRAGVAECATAASVEDGRRKFTVAFSDLTLAIRHEMVLEEEAYFPLVDKHFDSAATKADLLDAHRRDEELENAVDEALAEKREYNSAFDAWREHHLAHITRELAELRAPLAGLARKMGGAREGATALGKAALAPRMRDMPWFATWNVSTLRKHATFDELVAWVSALRRIASDEEWKKLEEACLKPLTDVDQARLQTEMDGVCSLVA